MTPGQGGQPIRMQDCVAVSQWECTHYGPGAKGLESIMVRVDHIKRQTGRQIMLFSQAVNIIDFLIQSVSAVIWILAPLVSQTLCTDSQNQVIHMHSNALSHYLNQLIRLV